MKVVVFFFKLLSERNASFVFWDQTFFPSFPHLDFLIANFPVIVALLKNLNKGVEQKDSPQISKKFKKSEELLYIFIICFTAK